MDAVLLKFRGEPAVISAVWYRCVTLITKAVKGRLSPENVRGLCENLHVKATGMTTAEHTKVLNAGKKKP